jgi:allantoicase
MVIGKIVVNNEVDKYNLLDEIKKMKEAGIDNALTAILDIPATIQVEPEDQFFCMNSDIGNDGCRSVDAYILRSIEPDDNGHWCRVCESCQTDEYQRHYDSEYIKEQLDKGEWHRG